MSLNLSSSDVIKATMKPSCFSWLRFNKRKEEEKPTAQKLPYSLGNELIREEGPHLETA